MNKVSNLKQRLNKFIVALVLVFSLVLIPFAVKADESEVDYYVHNNWRTSYESKEEAIIAGSLLNEQIADEGMVLLKNEDNALPLATGKGTNKTRITVLGHNSIDPLESGGIGDMSAGVTILSADIYSSLQDAGYLINPVVESQYREWIDEGLDSDFVIEEHFDAKKAGLQTSFSQYDDAAIVVLAATGAKSDSDGKNLEEDALLDGQTEGHSRQLDIAQWNLLKYANDNFDTVIVVINTSIPLELGFLRDDVNLPNLKAAILAGDPGANGFVSLGKIMNGTINPSGRLADIFPADMTSMPSWENFKSNGTVPIYADPNNPMNGLITSPINITGNQYLDEDGNGRKAHFVDYEEGIYVGYRYYETRGFVEGGTWYDDNVVYPFGHGLSYTTFNQEILSITPSTTINLDSEIKVRVRVTNTGDVAGKEVVQLYYTSPYTSGGIEKSHVVLGDFEKTDLLQPGRSQVVTLRLKARDMASYDWNDANSNNHIGYELEAGNYEIKLMNNSNQVIESKTLNVATTLLAETSAITGNAITNRFDYMNEEFISGDKTTLSRDDFEGTWPAKPTEEERTISDEYFANWTLTVSEDIDEDAAWYSETAPTFADGTRPEVAEVILKDLFGKDYNDPLWEDLLDQLTLEEARQLIRNGGFQTLEIPYIGKPFAFDTDGPHGWSGSGVGGESLTRFASAPVIAATWSKELSYEFGKMIGDQAIWGNSDLELGQKTYSGWYAPAINTHRIPLDWRYNEYFSEDGVLAGQVAANAAIGAREKGLYVSIKHFALHEDGSLNYRGSMMDGATTGLSIWVNEQALREVYLKPFQIAVEQADPMFAMSSFSRFGYTWAGASYGLLTEILRNEWGFEGTVITDIAIYPFMNYEAMVRAGGDLILSAGSDQGVPEEAGHQATHLSAIRNAVKNILYTVVNSNAMQLPINAGVVFNEVLLDNAKHDELYEFELAADFNTVTKLNLPTMRFDIIGGKLPDGLTLDPVSGKISGTPTENGTFIFTVEVTAKDYKSASQKLVLQVKSDESDVVVIPKVNVVFNTNSGNHLQTITLDQGAKLARPTDPVRDGFKFAGWYDNAELSGSQVTFDLTVDANTTLYAAWDAVEVSESSQALEITSIILSAVSILAIAGLAVFIFRKK